MNHIRASRVDTRVDHNHVQIRSLRWAIITCVAIALLCACSSEKRDWQNAVTTDSISAYKQYVWKNPQGEHASEAEKKIEDLEFRDAARIHTSHAYAAYLERYPDGLFAAEARKACDDLDWAAAENAWSRSGWQHYLERHPDGSHTAGARSRLEQLESDRLPDLRGAATVSIEVRQSFDEDVTDVDIGFDAELTRYLDDYGLERVDPASDPDATLSVRAYAEAWGANYSQFGFGWGTYLYTGARVSGRVTVEVDGQQLLVENFDGEIPTPYSTSGGSSDPSHAPYGEAMREDFPRKATRLLARAFGYRPLISSMGGPPDTAESAIFALARAGTEVRPLLIEALSIPNAKIRVGAAKSLAGHESPDVADALVQCLGSEGETGVDLRRHASESLATFGSTAMPALQNALRDERPMVREGAVAALGRIRTNDSHAMLVRSLDDPSENVVAASIAALGNHRSRAALGVLLDRMATSRQEIRASYLDAIQNSSTWDSYDPNQVTESVSWSRDLIERFVQLMALPGLDEGKVMDLFGNIGSSAVGPLAAALESDDPARRRLAIQALARSNDSGSIRHIQAAAGDPDPSVRLQVAKSMDAFQDKSKISTLALLLLDSDESIRDAALSGLSSASYLDGAKSEYRRHLSSPQAIAVLIGAMKGSDATKRRAAVPLLVAIGGEAVDPLIELARSGARPGCSEAVEALGASGDERGVEALIELSEIPAFRSDEGLMTTLYTAMGKPGNSKALSCLARGLDAGSISRRLAAIHAMESIGDALAVDHLIRVMGRGDPTVDSAALMAIQNLTHHYPGESDFDWKTWWNENRATYGVKG